MLSSSVPRAGSLLVLAVRRSTGMRVCPSAVVITISPPSNSMGRVPSASSGPLTDVRTLSKFWSITSVQSVRSESIWVWSMVIWDRYCQSELYQASVAPADCSSCRSSGRSNPAASSSWAPAEATSSTQSPADAGQVVGCKRSAPSVRPTDPRAADRCCRDRPGCNRTGRCLRFQTKRHRAAASHPRSQPTCRP